MLTIGQTLLYGLCRTVSGIFVDLIRKENPNALMACLCNYRYFRHRLRLSGQTVVFERGNKVLFLFRNELDVFHGIDPAIYYHIMKFQGVIHHTPNLCPISINPLLMTSLARFTYRVFAAT